MWDTIALELMALIVNRSSSSHNDLGTLQLVCKAWKKAASTSVFARDQVAEGMLRRPVLVQGLDLHPPASSAAKASS